MKNQQKKQAHYLILIIGMISLLSVNAQNKTIPLWENAIPGSIQANDYKEKIDSEGDVVKGVSQVSEPTLALFFPKNKKNSNTAVIICPGGGYSHLAINKEGYKVAQWLNTLGITGIVLKYRLPDDRIMENKTIGPLQDAQKAMITVRQHAEEWYINPDKIGIMGFSAGGHLAATLSTHYKQKTYNAEKDISARPDFSILVYPVISMKDSLTHQGSKINLLGKASSEENILKYSNEMQVDAETPPAFLVHAADDGAVPPKNSISYFLALKKQEIPAGLHIYQNGGHGFGLGTTPLNKQWPSACAQWLMANHFLKGETSN